MDIQYKEDELGKEFSNELNEILKIRKERRLIYGDSFLKENITNLLSVIDGKRGRFNVLLDNNKNHPKTIDELRDIINYYVFLICVLKKEIK